MFLKVGSRYGNLISTFGEIASLMHRKKAIIPESGQCFSSHTALLCGVKQAEAKELQAPRGECPQA